MKDRTKSRGLQILIADPRDRPSWRAAGVLVIFRPAAARSPPTQAFIHPAFQACSPPVQHALGRQGGERLTPYRYLAERLVDSFEHRWRQFDPGGRRVGVYLLGA